MKQRWFINAKERRQFVDKVQNGKIRGEVLNFNNTDDADNMDSNEEIEDNFAGKKAVAVAKANKTSEEVKELTDEEKQVKADKEARDEANKAHKTADSLEKENGKPKKDEDFADANGNFVPPELRSMS